MMGIEAAAIPREEPGGQHDVFISRALDTEPNRLVTQEAKFLEMFTVEYSEGVLEDLADLRAFDRKAILDQIEVQLTHQPTQETRNKKRLVGLIPPWEHVEPVWELRVGEFRVFYDVNEDESRVVVRAVRRKPPHASTEEIL